MYKTNPHHDLIFRDISERLLGLFQGVNGTCETCPDGYRPNALPQSCTLGNTILNSDVECVGMTGEICVYECNHGFSVGGTHRCGLQAFEGGFCHPNDCIEGYELDFSETVCQGFLGDECVYECDEGYSVTGHHMCGKNRRFSGGSCLPNPCTNRTSIPYSPSTCKSRTGDVCNFVCERGYFATGVHTCGADGALTGGACMPSTCSAGLTIQNSGTSCTGSTGYDCVYSCNGGYQVGQPHICVADNSFRGGTCEPKRCYTGTSLPHSSTMCNGTFTDVCDYECEPGYTANGVHTCTAGQYFAGGRCEANACIDGLTIPDSRRPEFSPAFGSTTCAGTVGSSCNYECDDGFTEQGEHVCTANHIVETCLATNGANAGHVAICAAVDISGDDAAADQVSCENGVCTYTAFSADGVYAGGDCVPTPAPPLLCGGDHDCGFKTCLLSQSTVDACAGITDQTLCDAEASCSYAATCVTVTTQEYCAQWAAGGVTGCTAAGTTPASCVATDGSAIQSVIDACIAEAANGYDACTAAGACTYSVGDCTYDDGVTCTLDGADQACTCDAGSWGVGTNRCLGTHDGTVLATCVGTNDGTRSDADCTGYGLDGRLCELNTAFDACEVPALDPNCGQNDLGCCIFVPEVLPTACTLNVGASACAVQGGNCVFTPATGAACALNTDADACVVQGGECEFSPSCDPGSVCELGVSFEIAAPTATSDRSCQNVSVSQPGQYVVTIPTLLADTVIADCYPGTYQNGTQQPDCPPCPAGTVDDDLDPATECTDCPVGQFILASGELECSLCAWGTYDHDYDGATKCEACMSGYNSTSDRSGCLPNVCNSGRDIDYSPVDCQGRMSDNCEFGCDAGYTAVGEHVCGTGGWFSGGWCAGNICTESSYVRNNDEFCIKNEKMCIKQRGILH